MAEMDLNGLRQEMPLDKFFEVLAREKNMKVFSSQQRIKTKAGQRGEMHAVLQLIGAVYGDEQDDCNSAMMCIVDMLKSDYLTKGNHLKVFEHLNTLFDKSWFDDDQNRSQHYVSKQSIVTDKF